MITIDDIIKSYTKLHESNVEIACDVVDCITKSILDQLKKDMKDKNGKNKSD